SDQLEGARQARSASQAPPARPRPPQCHRRVKSIKSRSSRRRNRDRTDRDTAVDAAAAMNPSMACPRCVRRPPPPPAAPCRAPHLGVIKRACDGRNRQHHDADGLTASETPPLEPVAQRSDQFVAL